MKPIWMKYLKILIEDARINVWHLALFLAIVQLAEEQEIRVSRSKLMYHSHINTLPTFHKYFKELQDFGYIKYTPSYHPGFRSLINVL
ncbi:MULTISPECIES: hypothetical protein [Sphingobacterium]|uniref:hypothetical protein n=1 Tax=Sphingobacterium TaxID=28453 RepID=UPI000DB61F89|nr:MULTISPECIES: hypothetical protein [Sphingobacterium]PZU13936.1 MAG: hypothetical protein DI622_13765 [Chryseobacterium sp.]